MGNKISVIMSVYNDQDNISNSIKSILGQTYKDFEFLIVATVQQTILMRK